MPSTGPISRASRFAIDLVLPGLALVLTCLVPPPAFPQQEKGAGIVFSGDASAKDVGLPVYPGSRRHKDKDNDSDANFRLWGGGSSFKLVVMKMESDDSPEKVADFYRKALAKYGRVLDCSHPAPAPPDSNSDSKSLTCGDDKPEKGGSLFKAGTKDKQHLAAIQPNAAGSLYQLAYASNSSNPGKK